MTAGSDRPFFGKQLLAEQPGVEGTTGDRQKRTGEPGAEPVNGFGYQFAAGTFLADDQYLTIQGGHLADFGFQPQHGR